MVVCMRSLPVWALPLILVLGCTKEPPAAPAVTVPLPTATEVDVAATADERRCVVDDDCTLTTEDCCGCATLGKQTGVRKDRVQALTERRRTICGAIACAQGMSDDPSCVASRAVCRQGQCVPDAAAASGRGVGVEKIVD